MALSGSGFSAIILEKDRHSFLQYLQRQTLSPNIYGVLKKVSDL